MDSWTSSAEAARLLASCATSPPRRRLFVYRFEEVEPRFVGRRVRRLSRLYRAAQPRLDSEEWRTWLADDPQSAIARAVDDRRRQGDARPVMAEPAERLMRHHHKRVAHGEDPASPEFRGSGATQRTEAAPGRDGVGGNATNLFYCATKRAFGGMDRIGKE
ncbi:hypothetical protein [Sphingosinicella terrae]|uniref:hypothetical protein n=1 Tax=Sphingosinicella terrae TaxID=2172047 RepID=UPI0013B3C4C6|nr:hypothetical protein [Sphingosinicella terrae]